MTVYHDTLANGFQVVTEHMPGLQSASLGVWVKAGGRHERFEQNGIAHFLEHMAFKGTKTRSSLQIAELIEDVGGYINAYTSREVTAYFTRVLMSDVTLAANLLFDILQNSIFDPKEIDIERGVILQEIGQTLDTPDDVIFDWLQETVYPNQTLGRTILGPSKRVAGFKRKDLIKFIEEHYSPNRMVLAAAGAVDHEKILDFASSTYGHLEKSSNLETYDKANFVGGEFRCVKDLEQAHVTIALESPSYKDDDFYAAQIYSVALGGGMSSRLFQEVREKRGLCYTIFSQIGAFSDSGMLTIYAGTGSEKVPELINITFDEIKHSVEKISRRELDRARAQMKAGLLMGLEGASNRAERMARMVQIWGRVLSIDETVAKIDAVNLSDLNKFAEKLTTHGPIAMALYGPIELAPSLEEARARLTL